MILPFRAAELRARVSSVLDLVWRPAGPDWAGLYNDWECSVADQQSSSGDRQAVCYAVYSWMFKEDAPIETIEDAFAEMVAIGDDVPGIQRASWGRNRAGSANGYTHTMIVIADDQAAVDEYNLRTSKHPMSDLVHSSEKQGIGVSYALPA